MNHRERSGGAALELKEAVNFQPPTFNVPTSNPFSPFSLPLIAISLIVLTTGPTFFRATERTFADLV